MSVKIPEAITDEYPVILQGSTAPVFRGVGPNNLNCPKCGQVLIEGYEPRCYIALDLQCFRCKTITRTDSWPQGEPLPRGLVTLGDAGRFLIGGTVDMTGKAGFICDQEIARVTNDTKIRPSEHDGLDLSSEGMTKLQVKLDLLSDGAFTKCVASTERAIKAGNLQFLNYPLAWAFTHLIRRINEGEIDLRGEDGAAFTYLQTLLNLVDRWKHHPLFFIITKALVNEFHHTMAMLIAASYLADHGNPIGFTDPALLDGRSPDLFINLGPIDRVSIEVKAPSALQWPDVCLSPERLERVIEKQLNKARGQITGESGGIVVLGASVLSPNMREVFENAVASLIKRGKVSTKIAGVAGICLDLNPRLRPSNTSSYRTEVSSDIFIQTNRRFNGPKFLKT